MSLKVADLYGELDLRKDKFDRGMSGIKGSLSRIGPWIAGAAVAGGVALGAGIYKAITASSDLNETISKSKVVFADQAREVLAWSRNSAAAMGQSRQAALENAATFGNLFVSMDMGTGVASKMSTSLVQLAGDLASFNNVDPAEAFEALRSGLVGETEPLRRFGVNINDAALRAQALKLGLIDSVKEGLTPAAKAQAAYALILDQTKTAQGDFARTSGGFANQSRILKAEIMNLFADIGKYVLPVATQVVKGVRAIVSGVAPMIDRIKGFFKGGTGSGDMAKQLTEPFKGIGKELSPVLADIGGKLSELWAIVGPPLKEIAKYLISVLGKAFTYLRPLTVEFGQTIAKQIGYVVMLARFIKQHWAGISQFVGPIFKIITTIISTAFKVIVDVVRLALSLMRGDWDGAKQALVRIAHNLSKALVAILKALGQLAIAILKAAWAGLKAATSAAWNAIVSAVRSAVGRLLSAIAGLPGRILRALGSLGSLLYDAGASLVRGLLNGIESMLSALWDRVTSVASDIKNKFTGILGINSPSTVFRDYGINIMRGLAFGLGDGTRLVTAAMGGVALKVSLPAVPVAAPAQVAAAGSGIHIDARGAFFGRDADRAIYDMARRGAVVQTRVNLRTAGRGW